MSLKKRKGNLMGMNIILRAKNEKLIDEYKTSNKYDFLNRSFNGFVWGKEAWGDNCEFNQIQEIFKIDLSTFRMFNYGGMGLYVEEHDGWRDWELSKVSTQKEIEKINKEYQKKLVEAEEQDLQDFQNNWVETKIMRKTIEELISKIRNNSDLLKEINYGSYLPENFEMNKSKHQENKYYILNDLEHIIDFIEFLEKKGESKMAFYGM